MVMEENKETRAEQIKNSFAGLAKSMDARHDKHEAVFKLSRDITTDSKRLIFSTHRILDQKEKESALEKLHKGLNDIMRHWTKMGLMLETADPCLVHRAFSPGLQEFIEALCFLSIVESSVLPTCDEVIEQVGFSQSIAKDMLYTDILLGIADVAGEIMRFVTNMASKGDSTYNLYSRRFLQEMYNHFISTPSDVSKELGRKTFALKGSMIKVEKICYLSTVQSLESSCDSVICV